MIRIESRRHCKSMKINRRETNRVKRSLFLNGRQQVGFLFVYMNKLFHILRNEEEAFCSLRLENIRRAHLVVKSMEEIIEFPWFEKYSLCTRCENNFIGLSKGETYRMDDGHIPIFQVFKNRPQISKDLLFMLKFPRNQTFPRLKSWQLKNAIYLKQ